MKKGILTVIVIAITALLFQCSTSSKTIPPNRSVVAKQTKTNRLNPSFLVYHFSKDSSKIYFKLSTSEILYTRPDQVSPYQSHITIKHELYRFGDSKTILDSNTVTIKDKTRDKTRRTIYGNFNIKTAHTQDYLLKIKTRDINRNTLIEKKIYIRKTDQNDPQYFLLTNDSTHYPVFENYITSLNQLQIHSECNKNSTIYIKHYNRDFNIAAPPFASVKTTPFNYTPDKIAPITLDSLGINHISPPNKGFILIQKDTSNHTGFPLFKFDENYPHIVNAKGLIEPLRYICSTEEYNTLLNSPTPKKSVDQFWLSRASSKARARELIKQYYNRVERANKKYTSYKEGWKTDRGMISIIFGTPTSIRRGLYTESWTYGEDNNIMALTFVFNKRENPFTHNDFKLQRSGSYKSSWYRAVDTWRNGRVFYGY